MKKAEKTKLSNKKAATYEDPLTKLEKSLTKKLSRIEEIVLNVEAIVEKVDRQTSLVPEAPAPPPVEATQPAEPTDPAAEASKPPNI